MTNTVHKINAEGQVLGRIASRAAVLLRGKDDPHFVRHLAPGATVEISNASKMKLSVAKLRAKTYARYSGYPGGLRFPTMEALVAKKGYAEPLRLAIRGMLPRNKLRPILMNHLKISE